MFQAVLILFAFAVNLSAQATDPLIGGWTLNLSKSTYEGVPPPKSQSRTFDAHGEGMILSTYEIVGERGNRTFGHWLVRFDGQDYPEYQRGAGSNPTALLSFKKVDADTVDVSVKHNGKIDVTGSWTVSRDGKTLTFTLIGTNAQGQPTKRVMVYDKQS